MAGERLVIDANYALESLLPTSESWRIESVELIESIAAGETDVCVPWLFFAEVANVVTKKVRRRIIDTDSAELFLARLDGLGLEVDMMLQPTLPLYEEAKRWQLSAYDAIYLDLARRMALPLATRDRGLASAARHCGVELFRRV